MEKNVFVVENIEKRINFHAVSEAFAVLGRLSITFYHTLKIKEKEPHDSEKDGTTDCKIGHSWAKRLSWCE